MSWSSPRTWAVGETVTAALANTEWRDQLRYLKGMDGTVQIQDGLELTGTGTASYLKPPVLTTTQRDAIVSPANGMVIFNSTDTKLQKYEGTWRSDMAYGGTLTYLSVPSMTTGDVFYASSGTSIARLAGSAVGLALKTQGTAAAPSWGASGVLSFSGTTVFNSASPTAWTDLDLGPYVGSAQVIALLQVLSNQVGVLPKWYQFASTLTGAPSLGTGGINQGTLDSNAQNIYLMTETDTSGLVRWRAGTASTVLIYLRAYWK